MNERSAINISEMSLKELTDIIKMAEKRRQEKIDEERSLLLKEFKDKAAALGLSLRDLLSLEDFPERKSGHQRNNSNGRAAIKFRGPNGEQWAGRGRTPSWLVALEAEGHDRSEYAVQSTI
jgi:DNA-binding protein H-NS